jgi:dTDP-glucose 4,6-dehydratase
MKSELPLRNTLVTGGAGFIGSNFVRYLLENEPDAQVVNLDILTYAGSLENLRGIDPDRHHFVQGDICDRPLVEKLLRQFEIDTIVHFAAETHVDRSILDPAPFIQTNIHGTFTLLEAFRKYWQEETLRVLETLRVSSRPYRFHHISTDEVYGTLEPDDPPFSETTPYAPNSPYAASKAASDHLVRAYGQTYGLPVTITNCSNNYGPHQFPEKLIPLMIANALNGLPLPIYGDGGQIRDWLFVEDHCNAILNVIHHGQPGETYNIGAGNQPPNLLVVHTLCEILDECHPGSPYVPHESLIRHVPDRPGHDRRYALDISKISRELGWRPRHSLSEGLMKTVEWYLANPEWIQSVQGQEQYQDWLAKNYKQRAG